MKKKIIVKLLALLLVLAAAGTDTLGQTRIRFARGTDSATVTGDLNGGATRKFLLRVADGQIVTINVVAANGRIKIGASDVHGRIDGGDGNYFEYTSDDNGDQTITLTNRGRSRSSFAMTVAVR